MDLMRRLAVKWAAEAVRANLAKRPAAANVARPAPTIRRSSQRPVTPASKAAYGP